MFLVGGQTVEADSQEETSEDSLLDRDIARPGSHWSSSYSTALSLVQSFILMLSYAIKNQLKAPKAPY